MSSVIINIADQIGERLPAHFINRAYAVPAFFIVGEIRLARSGFALKAEHHLFFIEGAGGIGLVHNVNGIANGMSIIKENVCLVAIVINGAENTAVRVLHGLLPLNPVFCGSTAHTPLRVFNTDYLPAVADAPNLIILGFRLGFRRVGGGLLAGFNQPLCDQLVIKPQLFSQPVADLNIISAGCNPLLFRQRAQRPALQTRKLRPGGGSGGLWNV
jgi:hypothetical protein